MASTHAAIVVINPSHPQTWPQTSDGQKEKNIWKFLRWPLFCIFLSTTMSHYSTGQSLPPTISGSSNKSCQTTVKGWFLWVYFPCFASIQYDTFELEASWRNINQSLTVFPMLPSLLPPGLRIQTSYFYSRWADCCPAHLLLRREWQCNAMWNVQCIPKIFCCTNSSTLTPFRFFPPYLFKSLKQILNLWSRATSLFKSLIVLLTHRLEVMTFQPKLSRNQLSLFYKGIKWILQIQIQFLNFNISDVTPNQAINQGAIQRIKVCLFESWLTKKKKHC